jgi:hypothetical protein
MLEQVSGFFDRSWIEAVIVNVERGVDRLPFNPRR